MWFLQNLCFKIWSLFCFCSCPAQVIAVKGKSIKHYASLFPYMLAMIVWSCMIRALEIFEDLWCFFCFVYYMTLFIHTLHNNLLVNKGVLMINRLRIFTGFIFYLYFRINQVRILVFYNYQIIVCLSYTSVCNLFYFLPFYRPSTRLGNKSCCFAPMLLFFKFHFWSLL